MVIRHGSPDPARGLSLANLARSVLPALAILAALSVIVVYLTPLRDGRSTRSTSATFPVPAGFSEVASVDLADGSTVSLWLGDAVGPKAGSCMYLVSMLKGPTYNALSACGLYEGPEGPPWLSRSLGVLIGDTGTDRATWVRLGNSPPIPVIRRHFISAVVPAGDETSLELLDDAYERIGYVPAQPIGRDA